MRILYDIRTVALYLAVLFSTMFTVLAQEPDWDHYPSTKDKLSAMSEYGRTLIRRQEYNKAIPVLLKGLQTAGQTSQDSFAACNYYLLGLAYRYKTHYDSAFYYLGRAKEIADPKAYTILRASVQIEYYAIFNRLGQTDSASVAINRMKELLPQLDSNSSESAKIEMYLGHDQRHKAKYPAALEYYYKALRTFENLKDSLDVGNTYISLANVFLYMEQNNKVLSYHQQAAALFTQMGRRNELVNELLNITDMYYTSGHPDSAEITVRKALPLAETLNEKTYEAYAYMHLGNIYKLRKKFREAEDYFSRAIRIGELAANENVLMACYQGLGQMYMTENQPARARPYLEKHFLMAKQMNSTEEIIEACWSISQNEYALHNYKKAYEYQKLFSTYRDSAYTESIARNTAEMEARYQAEKKEKEILLLKKDQQLAQLSLQRQKNFQAGAIVFLLLLLLIGFLVVNRYRILQRTRRIIDMERMRNTIARDLHDDIGSTLTSINILSKVSLQQHVEGNGGNPMRVNMQKIKDRSSAIMESMGDLVWTINPQNDTVEQMVSRMQEFTAEILEPLDINYTFNKEGDLSGVKLDIKRRKDLYLLFKEAVNNAAKYSHCTNLSIELRQYHQSLQLTVTDDGAGFNEQEVRIGNGLRNMRERAVNLRSGLQIDSVIGKGTRVAVEVPIT